jgi:hypothetical protein
MDTADLPADHTEPRHSTDAQQQELLDQIIRARAQAIFEARGGVAGDGGEMDDWLQAEREVNEA